ncbi:hypothetical protein L596_006335 [Steinernema carpocapsae]|uniref:SEFIR domain-containing protein n=1 Tax=Steinernema carpocapsae TaxID=34508 RepID=A0A4U8V3T0_STECR|nr:hypothetical protein L596_006335 [Steinernema carpocapsae]
MWVDCSEDVMAFLPNGSPIPDEAHDLRIENHIIRLSKSIDGRSNYQLKVDVSWQMPPTNSTALLKAFLLLISEKNGRHETCVFFNVSTTEWTVDAITSSPRFHISTNTMFNFGKQYTVELISLPETAAVTSKVKKQAIMPEYPEPPLRPNCTGYSDPAASKWIAAFKKIKVQQVAKTIQIQFATAPEHFCFEAYEVRLLDDDNNEESSYVININDVNHMKVDMVDNKTEYYGEYNFTNLKAEKWYTPQVIPIERASDGRCLCPVNGGDPYAPHIVCSCVAADAKKVMLPKILPPTAPTVEKPNSNVTINHSAPQNNWMFLFVALLILLLLVLFCIIYVIVKIYRRAQQRGKTLRIRFVHDMNSTENGLNGHMNGSVSHTPLISSHAPTNVLIIYSHDCGAHEAAVVSLAEYLRDVFDIEVHIDQWDQDDIDRNLMDYVSSSILKADKVIIINSIGAYQRYTAKIGQEIRIERTQPGTFDNMFVTQIDQTLQHPQIISVRFVYSGFSDVLPPLTGALQYVLPENLPPLLTAILNTPLKTDPRLAGHNPSLSRLQAAITRMDHLRRSDTHWFVNTHHRVLLNTRRPIKIEEVVKNDDEKETEEEMAPLVAERVPEPEPEELEDEAGPSEETVDLEPIVADVAVPPQPVLVRSGEDSPVLDSGFISDVLLTEEIGPARIQNNHPLKPIQVKPVNNNHRFIEDKLERSNDSGDSGVISDAEIRTLS